MKKRVLSLFIVSVFIVIISVYFILAQNSPPMPPENNSNNNPLATNPDTGVPKGLDDLKDIGDKLSDEEEAKAYLKRDWLGLLEKNQYLKPIIGFYQKISFIIEPVTEYTIGMKPAISWLFFLSLIIFIALLIYIFRITSLFEIASPYIHYGIIIVCIIFISYFGIAQKFANEIIKAIALTKIWYVQLILVGIVIIGFIVASFLSKSIQDGIKQLKDKEEKEQEKRDRETLHAVADTYSKGIKKL
jgi:hypothetical protein